MRQRLVVASLAPTSRSGDVAHGAGATQVPFAGNGANGGMGGWCGQGDSFVFAL